MSEFDSMIDELIRFDKYLSKTILDAITKYTDFIKKMDRAKETYHRQTRSNRNKRRFVRHDLEMKIKELGKLHKEVTERFEEVMYIFRDLAHINYSQIPDLNSFGLKSELLIVKINGDIEYFKNSIIIKLKDYFERVLRDLERENKVDTDFTRVYPKDFIDNQEASYHRRAVVKVKDRGSFANLKKHHLTRRSQVKNAASSSNNNSNNDRNYGFSSHSSELNLF